MPGEFFKFHENYVHCNKSCQIVFYASEFFVWFLQDNFQSK